MFLKNGYYFKDGVAEILREMQKQGYTPTDADFPTFLDTTSRRCLLRQSQPLPPSEHPTAAHPTATKQTIRQLVQKELLRDVYLGTKEYVG